MAMPDAPNPIIGELATATTDNYRKRAPADNVRKGSPALRKLSDKKARAKKLDDAVDGAMKKAGW